MTNIWNLVKGLGIAIGGAIVFSGNSTIAEVNLDATLPNNFGGVSENDGISGDNSQELQSNIDPNKTELNDAKNVQDLSEAILPTKKVLKDCWYDENDNRVCR